MSVRALTPELAEVSREKLKEEPEKLLAALQEIKDWLHEQPHLHANADDQWLAAYFRGCRFDLNKAKKKLDLFYTCRGNAPDFFQLHHKEAKFVELFETRFYLPLPKLKDPAASRVTLVRTGLPELMKHKIPEAFSAVQIIEKLRIMDDDNSIIAGNITVMDLKNTNITFGLTQLSITEYKKIIACQQDAVPFNDTIMIYKNAPSSFKDFMRNLFDDSNKKSLYFYGEDYCDMYTLVPKEVMPAEYGGSGGTIQEIIDIWKQKIEKYDEWLENDLKYSADESKRPGKPKTAQDMFGTNITSTVLDLFQELQGNEPSS